MKKVLYMMCASLAVLACTKTETSFDYPEQITFAPVAKNVTKAAVAVGSAPTSSLIVSANAGNVGVTSAQCTQEYFSEVTFNQEGSTGVFAATDCYWPNVQYLSFAGVTASEGVSDSNVSIDVDKNEIVITNYYQPQFNVENNDLMWFPSTIPVGKDTPTIEVDMYHACSWLVFNFKGDAVSGGTNPWKILRVDLTELSDKGTATINGDEIEWSTTGTKQSYNVYTAQTIAAAYGNSVAPVLQNCSTGGSGSPVSVAQDIVLVIPQTPCELSVTYQYLSKAGTTVTETAKASLDYSTPAKAWVAGTKYVYNVTIGATPIKIDANAGEWTTGSGSLDKTM